LDVSDYDPGTQWGVVASSGNHFAFIKATEGVTFTNDLFVSDWPAAQNAGLIRGAYHFFHPGDDPVQQAQFYLKTIGTLSASDLPPMLDWETTDGVSSAQQIANAKTWLTLVEAATGKTPIIYVDPSFWNALGNPVDFVQYPLFIAEYDVSCPQVPPPWSDWTFWQKQIGPIPGVQSAQADIDVFNGALQLLEQFGLVQ
jgi:lysozyme